MATSGRTQGRKAAHDEAMRAAAAVAVPGGCDVVVIGCGAAGIVAAASAAEAGADVIALDAADVAAKAILATGNGRCNLTNEALGRPGWEGRYDGAAFVRQVMGDDPLGDVRALFDGCGLALTHGSSVTGETDAMYPRSLRAESVREALLGRALRAGVTIAPARRAMRVVGHRDGLLVRYDELFCGDDPRTVSTSRIILAVGHDGLGAVSGLGLASTPATPVLCPLECVSVDGVDLSAMDGRRAICKVSLESGWEATGEVLFRGYGLSGIVIMDASRRVGEGDVITLDLVDGLTDDQVRRSLDTNSDLSGVIDPTIARALGQDPALARTLRFRVTGMHEEGAQVMRGGLDVDGFEPDTLESRLVPHLHACGEALDVDADCGGFNLTWAWLSGMVAGRAAGGAGRA